MQRVLERHLPLGHCGQRFVVAVALFLIARNYNALL